MRNFLVEALADGTAVTSFSPLVTALARTELRTFASAENERMAGLDGVIMGLSARNCGTKFTPMTVDSLHKLCALVAIDQLHTADRSIDQAEKLEASPRLADTDSHSNA